MNKINAFILSLLVLVCIYLFATSLQRVPAGEVAVVTELGVSGTGIVLQPRPLVNPGPGAKWFFKQPKIPIWGIGYLKEIFSLDGEMDFSTSFAYYTLDEITGNPADREIVSACIIEGKIGEVTDWELFISRLEPDKFNQDANPYSIKYRSRAELLAEQIKYLAKSGSPEKLYPGLVSGELQIMTPAQKIEYWYKELVSRRNFAVSLKDRYSFKSEEEYVAFLKNESPWYWGMGVQQFESILNQAKEMSEYLQSSFSEGLSARGYAGRYTMEEDFLLLSNMVRRTDSLDRSLLEAEKNILTLQAEYNEQNRKIRSSEHEFAYLLYKAYLEDLRERDLRIVDIMIEDLNDDFFQYIETEVADKLLAALRKRKLELAMENLAEYEMNVINNVSLDVSQKAYVEQAFDYFSIEYASYLESDNWENFSSTFSNELNTFVAENPKTIIPDDDVIQMIYFELLRYYLGHVSDRYKEQNLDSSLLNRLLFTEMSDNAELMNGNRKEMADLVYDYLLKNESLFIMTAGSMLSLSWNLNYQTEQRERLMDLRKNILVPYFTRQMEGELLIESESLWLAAIRDALNGEDLAEYTTTISHRIERGETLEYLAGIYGIDGREIIRHAHSQIRFEFSEDQKMYDLLNTFRNIDKVYNQTKRFPLKVSEYIILDAVPPYTGEWWDSRNTLKKQKDVIMKSFIYPWIDAHLPAAFDEFAASAPYIDYLETYYGVRLADLRLRVERRSVFSNYQIRQVDPDFAGVYKPGE